MGESAQNAFKFLHGYMRKHGGTYADWYAGIASDMRQRLFMDHNVDQEGGVWAHFRCTSKEEATSVEQALFRKQCNGGPGGGDDGTDFAYIYMITLETRD